MASAPTSIDPTSTPGRPAACGRQAVAAESAGDRPGAIQRILTLSVPFSATLAERDMTVASILAFNIGAILEFNVPVETELTLYVGNRPVGSGQAVKSGEKFGIRITRIDNVAERIGAMGPHQAID